MCVCVGERWYLHRLVHVISCLTYCLIKTWFECGLSSNQIRTNDVRNVVLLMVDPSSIHHSILWSDQCYHRVHLIVEFHFMEISVNCCWAHRQQPYLIHDFVGHQASVGNLCKHFLHAPFMKYLSGWKKWLPLVHVQSMQVAVVNSRKFILHPLESSQVSHARAKCPMVW